MKTTHSRLLLLAALWAAPVSAQIPTSTFDPPGVANVLLGKTVTTSPAAQDPANWPQSWTVDGTTPLQGQGWSFVFNGYPNASYNEYLAVSGLTSGFSKVRLFSYDHPSLTVRDVEIYYSTSVLTGAALLDPANYTSLGTFSPTGRILNYYARAYPGGDGSLWYYFDIPLTTPAPEGTQSLLARMVSGPGEGGGSGSVIGEIAAFTSTLPPAVSGTWNVTGGGSWTNASNWDPNGVPGNGGTAAFGAAITGNADVTLDGDKLISGLTFDNATKSYTISQGSSGTLTLSSDSGPVPATVTSGSHEISAPVGLLSDLAVSVPNSGDTFTLSGTLVGSSGVTKTGPGKLVLSGTGTNIGGTLTISEGTLALDGSGTYSGQLGGSGMLVKEGGTQVNLTYGDNSSSTGDITVSGGILQVNNGNNKHPLGNGSGGTAQTITINSGATLSLADDNPLGPAPAFDTTSHPAKMVINGGTLSMPANHGMALCNDSIEMTGGNINAPFVIGNFTPRYSYINSIPFTPTTATIHASATPSTITGPEMLLRGFIHFNVEFGATLQISSQITTDDGPTSAVIKEGPGTMILTHGNNTNPSATTVSAGRLNVNGGLTGGGTVTVAATGNLGGSNGSISGAVPLDSGGAAIFALSGTYNTGNDHLALGNNLTLNDNVVKIEGPATLDQSADYELMSYTGDITGSFNPAPTWVGTPPSNAALFSVVTDAVNKKILLHSSVTTLTYEAWAATHGISGEPAGGDFEGDGMTNFQEYAFGLTPTSGTSVNPISVPLNAATGKFSYTRTANTGLSYTVWTSTDLQTWDGPAAVSESVGAPVGGVETVQVTLSGYTPPPGGKLFVRVQAQ
ncbi:MAG: autotransporter-associated beta strand repeat-containing protein [Verrucomicrobia bacterium]|nr:autotransporter-associated beta strand repeat-containing protein [Verrucomicrobiota bacterium]